MSRTSVFAAFEDGAMKCVGEVHNSWNGAPCIWDTLAKRYCDSDYPSLSVARHMHKLWALADDPRLSIGEQYALVSTFDNALARPHIALQIADALEHFTPGTENLAGQAQAIRKAVADGAQAIGWHQTSVTQNPWSVHDRCPTCGHEEEESRPFIVGKDTTTNCGGEAWWIGGRDETQASRSTADPPPYKGQVAGSTPASPTT